MKKIYNNIILGFLILLLFSCYKDKSNTTFKALDAFSIDGVKSNYTTSFIAYRDTLKIEPIIISEKKDRTFEYFWVSYTNNEESLDTIGREKNLTYPLNVEPRTYHLVFSVKDTKTGNFAFKHIEFLVETSTSSGWYILKDKGGFTSLDLFSENGILKDMGRPLAGNAGQIYYTTDFNYFDPKTEKRDKHTICIIPMSSNDMAVIRLSDFKELDKFNELFYSVPPTIKPTFWFEGNQNGYLVNNNKAHWIDRNDWWNPGKFGESLEWTGNDKYSLSRYFIYPIVGFNYSILVFDEEQSTFLYLYKNKMLSYKDEGYTYPYKNLNSDLLYMGYKKGNSGNIGIAILKVRSGPHKDRIILTRLDMVAASYLYDWWNNIYAGGINPVSKMDTLSTTLNVANAELYTISKQADFLYYTKDNKIGYYDFLNEKEHDNIYSLPSGEKITYIYHYYRVSSWSGKIYMNKLVVASSLANGNYKVYLFDLLAGIPQSNPKILKGKGKVADVLYVKEMNFYNNRR
jgi:hypothetical protein